MEVCCIPSATRNLPEDVRVTRAPVLRLFSSSQDPEGGRHDRDTQPHAAATPHGPEFRHWAPCGLSIPHVTRPEAALSQRFLTG